MQTTQYMEFTRVGRVSLTPPPESLRSFMKRKYLTWLRSFEACRDGYIRRADILKEVEEIGKECNLAQEEKDKRMEMWDFALMCDQKSECITEGEAADIWVQRVYDQKLRPKYMEKVKGYAALWYQQMDLNKDGTMDFDEWCRGCKCLNDESKRILFDAIDVNHDGFVSLQEWLYGCIYYHFSSGPDNPISIWFGPIVEQ